ncbi:uncharacterized protein [Drosophila takahashii]|nr:uncharacterized protein LOC108064164 [Drosophila takahashii]XP_017007052.2 uncharacterized protein LOC108064164 [Drosophila takahashii]XP_017007053.2 uncharacterized protein LOC108064164 [Drosophila takahashii]
MACGAFQPCLINEKPICVIHEDCSFTLYNKCLLQLHKQFLINEGKQPFKTFITGSCPKDSKLCPYNTYLPGLTFG